MTFLAKSYYLAKKKKRKLLQSVTLKYHLIWIKPYVLSFFPGGSNSGKNDQY